MAWTLTSDLSDVGQIELLHQSSVKTGNTAHELYAVVCFTRNRSLNLSSADIMVPTIHVRRPVVLRGGRAAVHPVQGTGVGEDGGRGWTTALHRRHNQIHR